ncbi:hypothetical protein HMPREF1015_02212, partial [Bacillus smithii 7_3_47FAA]
NYDAVIIEDLDMKGMSQASTLEKAFMITAGGCSLLS